jgi:hypothetical protein
VVVGCGGRDGSSGDEGVGVVVITPPTRYSGKLVQMPVDGSGSGGGGVTFTSTNHLRRR